MQSMLTIGKVARQAAVNVQTIRYYERIGLLKPEARRESGYRLYSQEAARKVQFVKHAQELGFSLKEIAGLLRLRLSKHARCEDVRKKAGVRLKDVKGRIARLRRMARTLEELIAHCRTGSGRIEDCPILKSLDAPGVRPTESAAKQS